ncbi:MAG: ABC transporter ATP-binding protein [Planctomycetaceae bacterium]|nr:ABC transporter ATP-binding protein [Planctomycetaceae bacterium]
MIVETNQLTKTYGPLAALRDCSLAVNKGEVFGLLGPNGAGKTTLIRILLGYLKPSSGWAKVDGLDCERKSVAVRRVVAYLPAEASMFPQMNGRDALKFFAEIRPGSDLLRSLKLAQRLELDLSRRIGLMSTGMKQKLALAATLAAQTPIYILDEPTSNLDPTVRQAVLALVNEARAAGKTVLFSSHVLSEVEEVCDRVVILRAGRLVHTQIMRELRTQHRIAAQLSAPLPPIPQSLRQQLVIASHAPGEVTFETPGELAPLLGWLATLPLADVRIEPVGLRAIYDRYHSEQPLASGQRELADGVTPHKQAALSGG